MLRLPLLLLTTISISSCTVSVESPWKEPEVKVEEDTSYVMYDFVHTNPPGDLYPPPKLIVSSDATPSYYNENELEAYAAALLAYHQYLVRYLNAMEDSNGNPILEVGKKGCTIENLASPQLDGPPKMPSPPSITNINKSKGAELIVEYLGDVDKWMEDTEDYYVNALQLYEDKLDFIRAKCL